MTIGVIPAQISGKLRQGSMGDTLKNFSDKTKTGSKLVTEQVSLHTSVDPKWLRKQWDKPDVPDNALPQSLYLSIADKNDSDRISAFFNSKKKENADPKNFVKPRNDNPIPILGTRRNIALIEDYNADITAVCFAFTHRVNDIPGHHLPSNISEIGTVLSCAKGLGLSLLTISALSLSIKEKEGADHPIIAKVSTANDAANKMFSETLGWRRIENDDTLRSYYKSKAGDTIRPEKKEARNWYEFDFDATGIAKNILFLPLENGYITSRSGVHIPLEYDYEDFHVSFNKADDHKFLEELMIANIDERIAVSREISL